MNFTELNVQVEAAFAEILIAELAELGFDSFVEDDQGFQAYITEDKYNAAAVAEIMDRYAALTTISTSTKLIPKSNWNEEWEKNYDPILVDDRCFIRATFHEPKPEIPMEVLIVPKMSFGTGHHATTYLMTRHLLDTDVKGKKVLDAGCGTGILAIVAAKLGASPVDAYDIDTWCVENSLENFALNDKEEISIAEGTIKTVQLQAPYDLILANINKNVLLDEMEAYAKQLSNGALLYLSGFYTPDIPDLLAVAEPLGFRELGRDERNKWACLRLQYNNAS